MRKEEDKMNGFASSKRKIGLNSMINVDCRRLITTPLFYIFLGICLVTPILILVMTTMMDGTVTVNPQTNVATEIEAFDNVWQIIGSTSSQSTPPADMNAAAGMDMSLTAMCNINLVFFGMAAFVCLFVGDDFRSGYSKNIFARRSLKRDYVISKTLVCFFAGAAMLVLFFIGSMIGGAISSLPFELGEVSPIQVFMCMLSKILLMAVFVSIYLLASLFAKQKIWLSIIISLGAGMLLFMMIPAMTPLDSGIMNVILTLAGGLLFGLGLGYAGNLVLKKTDIV